MDWKKLNSNLSRIGKITKYIASIFIWIADSINNFPVFPDDEQDHIQSLSEDQRENP